jgi:hypothetical protein
MRLRAKTLRRIAYGVGALLLISVVGVVAVECLSYWTAGPAGLH